MKMRTKTLGILGALVFGMLQLQAMPITGSLTIEGGAQLDDSLNDATQVTTFVDPNVTSASGSFAAEGIASGDLVTMTEPWVFGAGLAGLWTVGGFTFDLLSSTVVLQNSDFLTVEGEGTVSGNGYDPTGGIWRFTTQSPAADGIFSFSASTDTARSVPDGGASAILLGLGVLAIGAIARRK